MIWAGREKREEGNRHRLLLSSPASSPSSFITRFNLPVLSWIIRSICSPGKGGDLQMFAASVGNLAEDRRPQPTSTTSLHGEHHQSRGQALTPPTHSITPKRTAQEMMSPESNSPLQQWLSQPLQESVKIPSSAIVIPPNIWGITGALAVAKPGAHHPRARIPPRPTGQAGMSCKDYAGMPEFLRLNLSGGGRFNPSCLHLPPPHIYFGASIISCEGLRGNGLNPFPPAGQGEILL